ncbi:hypothetical protein E2P81_ATG06387 [Venturia nashicola]|nr:hypothetical protein E2P81_ATG06387 [Venturia nashicola]
MSQGSLLGLPVELRLQTLGYLLLSGPQLIQAHKQDMNDPKSTLDGDWCYPAILRANQQIHISVQISVNIWSTSALACAAITLSRHEMGRSISCTVFISDAIYNSPFTKRRFHRRITSPLWRKIDCQLREQAWNACNNCDLQAFGVVLQDTKTKWQEWEGEDEVVSQYFKEMENYIEAA